MAKMKKPPPPSPPPTHIPSSDERSRESVIARILNEAQHSQGVHARRAKELLLYRSKHRDVFLADLWKCLLPIFCILRREPSVERVVRFVIYFATLRDQIHGADCDSFLEEFFGLLLFSTDASNKAVRLRSCQILSEVILRLHEDSEVSDEVWDNVIKSMCKHMQDKMPAVRVYSARALARFASADDGSEELEDAAFILSTYRKSLQSDQNAEVRKNIILSIPASNSTVSDIVERTADVSESVRKTAFFVLAKKFPIQSLSIRQRNTVLQRGLHDRAVAVKMECLKMLKDAWLMKCCQGEPISLLKYLDVETNESVGESVMLALLNADMVKIQHEHGLKKFIPEGNLEIVKLMEPEEALYWRLCISYFYSEAQAKGHDAAVTRGAQATMNAAAASERNDLLDKILPSTMEDYVAMVQSHLVGGIQYHFASRQLLVMGRYLDFSDATSRKVAGSFLQTILHLPAGHLDNDVVIGDGVSLGGDKQWATAVAELSWKVHGTSQEFIKMTSDVVAELGKPCREGGASIMQWVNCLAATGFLLEHMESLHQLNGHSIEAHELFGGILLPAAKHIHPEVQISATRCLGLFCLRETRPSLQAVKQLWLLLIADDTMLGVKNMACKALFDLCMWHSAAVIDRIICFSAYEGVSNNEAVSGLPILEEFAQFLDANDVEQEAVVEPETGEVETVKGIIAEGFAKLLLQSRVYSDILPLQHSILGKLLRLYFNEETKSMPSLRQCLAVFFETYPSISLDHKTCIARTFIPVLRAEWPGICGNECGTPGVIAAKKKRAINLSKFMLQMLHQPLFEKENSTSQPDDKDGSVQENGSSSKEQPGFYLSLNEDLATRIAVEIAGFPSQRSATAKSYLLMLIKTLSSLEFTQPGEQLMKCMRMLLDKSIESMAGDKPALKEIDHVMRKLKAFDATVLEDLSDEQFQIILCNMELEDKKVAWQAENQESSEIKPETTKKSRGRRRPKKASSPEGSSTSPPMPVVEVVTPMLRPSTQRASKTAALGKLRSDMATNKKLSYATSEEDYNDDDEEDISSPSSDDDSQGQEENFGTDSEFDRSKFASMKLQ